jgi:ATP-dependent Clp protease adaptor protein ClpS
MIYYSYTQFEEEVEVLEKVDIQKSIVLFNDDYNTFDHVITCLVEYCDHTLVQAEQCAYIVHYNGKCSVKSGSYNDLKPIKEALQEEGLSVQIR